MVANGVDMVPDKSHHGSRDRMTVAEAARALGVSQSTVRRRVKHGKLEHERTPNGRLIVYLDKATTSATHRNYVSEESHAAKMERHARGLEDEVEHLRNELDQERDDNRQNKLIITALKERSTELEASQTAAVEPERREPHLPTAGPAAPDEGDEHPRVRTVPETEKDDVILAQFFVQAGTSIVAVAIFVISVLYGQVVLAGLAGALTLLSIVGFLFHWILFRFARDRVQGRPSEPPSSTGDIQ